MSENVSSNWVGVPLGQLIEPAAVRCDPSENPNLPFIGLEHVESRTMRLLGTGESRDVKGNVFRFSPGEVLYARLRPNLSKVVRVDFHGVCSTEFIVFPEIKEISPEFLKFVLASPDFTQFALQQATGDRPRVSFRQLKTYVVNLPPSIEQERITAVLNNCWKKILDARDLLRALPARIAAYREEVLASAFRGELTEDWRRDNPNVEPAAHWVDRIERSRLLVSDEAQNHRQEPLNNRNANHLDSTKVSGVPGWTLTPLGSLFDVHVGATPSRSRAAYWEGNIPWVSSGEIKFNRITSTRESITQLGLEHSSTMLHPVGTVLLAMIGEGKTRGQAAILDIEACNNQNSAAIRLGETKLPSEYLFYFLWHNYEQTRRMAEGNSQPALNKSRVASILMPIPPLDEASAIVTRLNDLFMPLPKALEKAEEVDQKIELLRDKMIGEALSGELVSPTADIDALLAELPKLLGADLERRLPSLGTELQQQRSQPRGKPSLTSGRRNANMIEKHTSQPIRVSDALVAAGGRLSPEQLFDALGFSTEETEAFFLTLRDAVRAGEIVEDRSDPTQIVLSVRVSK